MIPWKRLYFYTCALLNIRSQNLYFTIIYNHALENNELFNLVTVVFKNKIIGYMAPLLTWAAENVGFFWSNFFFVTLSKFLWFCSTYRRMLLFLDSIQKTVMKLIQLFYIELISLAYVLVDRIVLLFHRNFNGLC